MTTPNHAPVDLRKCQPGDRLRYRDGMEGEYVMHRTEMSNCSIYEHESKRSSFCYSNRNDGRYFHNKEHDYDIVAVITGPGTTVKPAKPKKKPRTWKRWAARDSSVDLVVFDGSTSRQTARETCGSYKVIRVEVRELP